MSQPFAKHDPAVAEAEQELLDAQSLRLPETAAHLHKQEKQEHQISLSNQILQNQVQIQVQTQIQTTADFSSTNFSFSPGLAEDIEVSASPGVGTRKGLGTVALDTASGVGLRQNKKSIPDRRSKPNALLENPKGTVLDRLMNFIAKLIKSAERKLLMKLKKAKIPPVLESPESQLKPMASKKKDTSIDELRKKSRRHLVADE